MPSPLSPRARRDSLVASAAASALAGLRIPVDVLVARGRRWLERLRGRPRAGLEPRAGEAAAGASHGPERQGGPSEERSG